MLNSANSRMCWGTITFTYFSDDLTSLMPITTMMMTMIISAKHPAPAPAPKPMISPCGNSGLCVWREGEGKEERDGE